MAGRFWRSAKRSCISTDVERARWWCSGQ